MVADCNGLGWSNFNSEHEKMFTDVVTVRWLARLRWVAACFAGEGREKSECIVKRGER